MADFNVRVVVDPTQSERGSRQVTRSLNNIENAADRVRGAIRGALQFIGVAAVTQEIVQLSDAYTNLQNRLRVVTNGQGELAAATQEVFNIAQRTRSAFEGTAELFSRVSLASRDLGISQQQATQFTESLNQAIILSGASAREANAGLIQLSQGIASGTLRGDELRSVLEQLPVVADIIAQELGVTRGELRGLGAEGQLSAQVILRAFANAREELSDRFGRTIPTLGQSFVVLRNSVIRTIGTFNEFTGASSTLSRFIIDLANNMDDLARAVGAVAIVLSIQFAGRAIPRAIAGIRALTVAIAANPFGALAVAITTVIAFLATFSDRISIAEGSIVTLRDVAVAAFQIIRESLSGLIDAFVATFNTLSNGIRALVDNFNIGFRGFLIVGAQTADDFVELFFRAFRAVVALWDNFPATIDTIFSRAFNNAIGTVESSLNRIIGAIQNSGLGSFFGLDNTPFTVELPRFEIDDVSTITDLAQDVANAFNEELGLNATENFINRVISRAEELAQIRVEAERANQTALSTTAGAARAIPDRTFEELLRRLERENQLLRLNSEERLVQQELVRFENRLKRSLTETERARVTALVQSNIALERQNEIIENIRQPIMEYQNTLTTLNTLLQQGRISQEQFNLALSQTELATGVRDIRADLDPFGTTGELDQLRTQLMERQEVLRQAQEAEIISEQEKLTLLTELNRQYNQNVVDLEQARFLQQTGFARQTAQSLASISRNILGEQSSAYRALFAVSKAFAIADATIQIANALAKAANTPFPANLAAIATVAASTASIVSTITSTQPTGFQNGGTFRVGGSGGTDSQLVQFRASPDEEVSIRTPGQVRQDRGAGGQGQAIDFRPNITAVVVTDESQIDLSSTQAEEEMMFFIRSNRTQINGVLGGSV